MLDNRYFFPKVLQALPSDDYKVYAYFNDGSIRCKDVKPLIRRDSVFLPLENKEIFLSSITVMNNTVAWDLKGDRDPYSCIDLDVESLFECPEVADPLMV